MRCHDCQTEPTKPARFCECCGAGVHSPKSGATETPHETIGTDAFAAGDSAADTGCCQTCGKPSHDHDLCDVCRHAFTSLLGSPAPATAGGTIQDALDPREIDDLQPPASSAPQDTSDGEAAARWAQLALPYMASWSAKAEASESDSSRTARTSEPAPAHDATVAPASTSSGRRSMALAAAAVLAVATVGAPQVGRRLGIQWPALSSWQAESAQAMSASTSAPSPALATSAATDVTLEASAPPPETEMTKPASQVGRRAPARVRQQTPPIEQAAPVIAAVTAPPAAPLPPPAPLVEPAPVPAAPPAPPTGRFFEATDVDEMPRIMTRVEPQVPADLAARPFSDVVVVRVLVSQNGHPFRVSLLRKSKLGASLDEAVVDAVTQWKFSPAQKRGEAVSSWYNIGLPLGGAQQRPASDQAANSK